jgi:hypothetical protein
MNPYVRPPCIAYDHHMAIYVLGIPKPHVQHNPYRRNWQEVSFLCSLTEAVMFLEWQESPTAYHSNCKMQAIWQRNYRMITDIRGQTGSSVLRNEKKVFAGFLRRPNSSNHDFQQGKPYGFCKIWMAKPPISSSR